MFSPHRWNRHGKEKVGLRGFLFASLAFAPAKTVGWIVAGVIAVAAAITEAVISTDESSKAQGAAKSMAGQARKDDLATRPQNNALAQQGLALGNKQLAANQQQINIGARDTQRAEADAKAAQKVGAATALAQGITTIGTDAQKRKLNTISAWGSTTVS